MTAKIDDNSKLTQIYLIELFFKLKQTINLIVFCLNRYFTIKNDAAIALSRSSLLIIIFYSKHSKQWRILEPFSPDTDEIRHVYCWLAEQAIHRYVISRVSLIFRHMRYENHHFANIDRNNIKYISICRISIEFESKGLEIGFKHSKLDSNRWCKCISLFLIWL